MRIRLEVNDESNMTVEYQELDERRVMRGRLAVTDDIEMSMDYCWMRDQ